MFTPRRKPFGSGENVLTVFQSFVEFMNFVKNANWFTLIRNLTNANVERFQWL